MVRPLSDPDAPKRTPIGYGVQRVSVLKTNYAQWPLKTALSSKGLNDLKAAVIVFPGSNCDRDVKVALEASLGRSPVMVWHRETKLPAVDLIVVPGGFSYGDYLRSGAMAAHSPIMREVKAKAEKGVAVLGICNGFQILTETGMLPGALMKNSGLRFVCKDVFLQVGPGDSPFTNHFRPGSVVRFPIAHGDGSYAADEETLRRLEKDGRIAFRYSDENGVVDSRSNPNGSVGNIAGITSENGRILGMMPHPERVISPALGGTDGRIMFDGLAGALS